MEFQKAAASLCAHFENIGDYEPRSEQSHILEILTKNCKEHQTVVIFCNICAEILESGSSSEYPGIPTQHIEPLTTMLFVLVNCSDNNDDMSSIISKQSNFLRTVTKKLQQWTIPHFSEIDMKSVEGSDILDTLCTVLHNITMFEDNVPKVRDVNCIEAMKPYLESKDNTIRLLCLATLADLVNESESEIIKSNGDVIEFLMLTISKALETDDRTEDGWSLMELARIVHQVARNDNNKRTVVTHGAVPLLVKIHNSGNIEEQREAARAIWTLSFDKQNKKEMIEKKTWNVIETLEKKSQSSDEEVKEISKQALWTIKDQQNSFQPLPSDSRHIMISYNWGHQDKVLKIRDSLKDIGHRVWMDVDNMHGSTIDSMAKAVEEAYIVLMCYSFKYKNSDSCRNEAEYAYTLKKNIIPLKMEKDYKADGWLGFIIGAKKFFEFSGKYEYGDKVNELIREVQEAVDSNTDMLVEVPALVDKLTAKPILQSGLPVMSAPKPKEGQSNVINIVRKWTPSEVEKWLDKNNLPKKLLGRLRGKDIAFLRLLANQSHNTFYQTIREQLNIKDIKSMSDFLFALEDIDADMTDLHSSSSL
ncbi:uncharacterized protein LOC143081913 [Mytilus galloprovincialis]|uniref:uncharacterized protein LOC143081913 n=1 Tax=Mytilus galloprovincialis TaxID=29158 RepID=UPI003F7BA832